MSQLPLAVPPDDNSYDEPGGRPPYRPDLQLVPPAEPGPPREDSGEDEYVEAPAPDSGTVSLRPHQKAAVGAVLAAVNPRLKDGSPNPRRIRKPLVVKATGVGKTIDMADLARRANDRNRHCLWLIPSGPRIGSLVRQGAQALSKMGRVALIEKASQDALPAFLDGLEDQQGQTVIASVPTLQGARLERWVPLLGKPLILIDEAHHAVARTVLNIIECFPASVVVGFTATADRADGVSLGKVFDAWDVEQHAVYEYPLPQAVQDGWLVQPLECPVRPDPPLDLKSIKITADGDFDEDELEAYILENMNRLVSYAKPVLQGRRTLAFAPNIQSAHALAEALKMVGLRAAYVASKDAVTGKPMSEAHQDHIIDEFEAGRYEVLCNPIMLAEGFDRTFIDCVAVFRPTRARNRFAQMVGRGTRLHEGKDHCLVVNFTSNDHDLVGLVDLYDHPGISDEVVRRAKEIVREGRTQDPQQALDLAQGEHDFDLSRRLQIREHSVNYDYKVYNPLAAMEILGVVPKQSNDSWYENVAPESKDLKFLNSYYNKPGKDGKPRNDLDTSTLSYYSAKTLARKTRQRMTKGLCNHRQMALLIARGLPPMEAKKVKFSEVSDVLGRLSGHQEAI